MIRYSACTVAALALLAAVGMHSATVQAGPGEALAAFREVVQEQEWDSIVAGAALCPEVAEYALCLTLTPDWQIFPYEARRNAAVGLWRTWAAICLRETVAGEADFCKIALQSESGEALGGSQFYAGSAIWVQK